MSKPKVSAYLLPEVVDPAARRYVCVPIPDDRNHLLAFLGQLDALAYWWTWDRDDAHIGTEVARVWREIVAGVRASLDAEEGCAGMPFFVRQNTETPCILEYSTNGVTWLQFADLLLCPSPVRITRINPGTDVYEISDDGGATWEEHPELDPRNGDWNRFPPRSDEDRCNAAASMVRFCSDWVDQSITQISLAVSVAGILIMILGFLAAIAGLPFATPFMTEFALGLIGLGATAIDNAFTSVVYDELLCIFYCNIDENGQMSAAQFDAIISKISATFEGDVVFALTGIMQLTGPVGMSNAGAIGADTDDCSGCECVECADLCEPFTGGAMASTSIADPDMHSYVPKGVYNGSEGHTAAGCVASEVAGGEQVSSVTLDFGTECTFERIEYWRRTTSDTGGNSFPGGYYLYNGAKELLGGGLISLPCSVGWSQQAFTNLAGWGGVRYVTIVNKTVASNTHYVDDICLILDAG